MAFRRDRRNKVVYGCMQAMTAEPDYIMPLDADDRLNKGLAAYLESAAPAPAWKLRSGYVVDLKSRRYYLSDWYSHLTGSSIILDPRTTGIPEAFIEDKMANCYWYAGGHHLIEDDFEKKGIPIQEVPFPGGCYLTGYGDNLSNAHYPTHLSHLRRWLRFLVKGKRIDNELSETFGQFDNFAHSSSGTNSRTVPLMQKR